MKKSVLESIIRRVIRENEDISGVDPQRVYDIYIDQIVRNYSVSKAIGKLFTAIIYKIYTKIGGDVSFDNLMNTTRKACTSEPVVQKVKEIITSKCECEEKEKEAILRIIERFLKVISSDRFFEDIKFEIVYQSLDVSFSKDGESCGGDTQDIIEKEKFDDNKEEILKETPNRIATVFIKYLFGTTYYENSDSLKRQGIIEKMGFEDLWNINAVFFGNIQ